MKLAKILFLIWMILNATGCPKCCFDRVYIISGIVVDQSNTPIPDVDVYEYYPETDTSNFITKTNPDGYYTYNAGTRGDSNSFVFFKKAGYQDYPTASYGGGNDDECRTQYLERNGVMVPQLWVVCQ